MARLMRNGEKYQKNFTLSKYETWEKAERAARRWVNKTQRELPPPGTTRGKMTHRNSSGIVGVWARHETSVRNGRTYEYAGWSARWPGCPKRGGIAFSITKYGDKDAFVLAALAVENETVERDVLEKKLKRMGKKKYASIIAKKEVDFVD